MSAQEIENLVAAKLDKKSSAMEIEKFFDDRGWIYGFDRHQNRYQARNPDEVVRPEISRHLLW
ncbi:MAG: hypothetical protein WEA82_05965 [Idiomarina sp.]